MSTQLKFDAKQLESHVPTELRDRDQWVAWRYVVRDGKSTKVPVNPKTGESADSTGAETWGSYDQAIAACEQDSRLAGVGFVFASDDPYCGVDLDHAIDPRTGNLKRWAEELVERLDSYTEVSPSGTGLKVFIRGKKPGGRCKRSHHDGAIEVYDHRRFFTVTGSRIKDAQSAVAERQFQLEQLYGLLFGADDDHTIVRPPASIPSAAPLSDDEIIEIAKTQRRSGAKFTSLWQGDWNAHFNSASEADSSLVFTLAFYTKDSQQLDRLFRASGLMRPKWDERHGDQTYGAMTIEKALSKVTRQYEPRRSKNRLQSLSVEPSRTELPEIIVVGTQLRDLTDKVVAALRDANTPPYIFMRGGTKVRIIRDEKGNPIIEPLDRYRLRQRIAEVANFFALRKGEGGEYVKVSTVPPLFIAENVLAQPAWTGPPLAGITRAPILRRDGTICTQPGYDRFSQLMYCPDPSLDLVPIPEFPNSEEVQACIDLLLDVLSDFPFADKASRANALALLFTLLMRPVITGHIPLAIVDAPMQGTGKTLLVKALGTIALGGVSSESIPAKNNEDEWRKKVTSILLSGSLFVLLDNIPDNTTIDSPVLAALLTSDEWSDRLLGKNSSVRLPANVVWAATGNNLKVTGDMPRRSYSIRLDANAERPWKREGFKVPDLERHVAEQRGNLLSAALTIIRAWYTHGRPEANVPTLGSFGEWARTIGSVLSFAGVQGFLENLEQTQSVQDQTNAEWGAFFEAWWEIFGDQGITADHICRQILATDVLLHGDEAPFSQVLPDQLLLHKDRGEGALKRSIGHNLSRLAGRIFNGRKLTDAGMIKNRHVRKWRLEEVNSSPNSAVYTSGA